MSVVVEMLVPLTEDKTDTVFIRMDKINLKDLAHQWTLSEHYLFSKISLGDFRAASGSQEKSLRLKRKIESFNRVSGARTQLLASLISLQMSTVISVSIVRKRAVRDRVNQIKILLNLCDVSPVRTHSVVMCPPDP